MSGNKASVLGDVRMCPNCNTPLPNSVSTTSSPNVFINGKPVLRAGDTFSPCVCPGCNEVIKEGKIVQGSSNIFINGMPMAFDSCSITGGGVVVGSSSNVFIGNSPINIEDILPNMEQSEIQRELSFNTNQPIINNFNENTSSSKENAKRYSIQFCISDTNGNRCDGMFYTIKIEDKQEIIIGETDEEGCTEQVFSEIENDKAYLYIGHRQESFDDLLIVRTTDEHIHDEFILNYESVDNQIMTLFQENQQNKICQIRTQRLWKPWNYSESFRLFLMEVETLVLYFRDIEGNGRGNTIGYGHYETVLLGDGRRNPVFDRYMRLYPDIRHPISEQDAINLLDIDIVRKGGVTSFNSVTGENAILVPLYQYEFDALVDITYNSGIAGTGVNAHNGRDISTPHNSVSGETIKNLLHAGRYTEAGNTIPYRTNTVNGIWIRGIQRRRNAEKGIFFNEHYTWSNYTA